MTSQELKSMLLTRGSTLCLGLNAHIGVRLLMKILTLDIKLDLSEDRYLLLFNNIGDTTLESIYVDGFKWMVVQNVKSNIFRSPMVLSSMNDTNDWRKSDGDIPLSQVKEWNINNVWLFDIFPYQTQIGVTTVVSIKDWCQRNGYGFGVGLVTGYNQYGSTDISSEEDAIRREKEYLENEGVSTIVISKSVTKLQAYEIQTLGEDRLEHAMRLLSEDKQKTLDYLEDYGSLLGSLLTRKVGDGVEETVKSLKKDLDTVTPLFPALKYLDSNFFKEYEQAIAPLFINHRYSDATKINNGCAETLARALKFWIKQKI